LPRPLLVVPERVSTPQFVLWAYRGVRVVTGLDLFSTNVARGP
jgi:hypothetical protein